MADPKGTYFSPQTPETGWATVLPERPHRSYANLFAKDMAARRKAQDAEDKAKRAALSKLKGVDVGKLHHKVYREYVDGVIKDAPNKSSFELESDMVKANAFARATKDVARVYDDGIKWITDKKNPVKSGELSQWWADRFANPSLETAPELVERPPMPTEFLDTDGGSRYIDVGRAAKMVINEQFKGYAKDDTEWKRSGWSNTPYGAVADINTFQTKVQAFSTYDPTTNEVVMKGIPELIGEGILSTFMENEYMDRAINDGAKQLIAEERGVNLEDVDDLDVTDDRRAQALQSILTPYVQGVVAERGMSLAIRPSGGGGGSSELKENSFERFVQDISQGAPTAFNWAIGGRWGETNGIVVGYNQFGGTGGEIAGVIAADPATVRRNYEQHEWFRGLTEGQKREIVRKTASAPQGYNREANVLYSFVVRRPVKKQSSTDIGVQTEEYVDEVYMFNPSQIDRGLLANLYEAGRGAKNMHYIEAVGRQGERQMGYEYQQQEGWRGIQKGTQPKKDFTNPLSLMPK